MDEIDQPGVGHFKHHIDAYLCLLLIIASFALYWWSMPRSITLIDAGLFQMVCDANGLAHPSGFPIATLLCHGLSLLPLPNVVAGNLISLLFGAGTVALTYLVALKLPLGRWFAFGSALLLGCSADFWSQSVIVEVYTLNSFLFLALLWLALTFSEGGQFDDRQNLKLTAMLALVGGAALANHWPLVVLSSPAILVLLLRRFGVLVKQLGSPGSLSLLVVALLVGLSPYLLLLTKNSHEMLTHGPITSVSEWLKYIARLSYNDTIVAHENRSFSYLWWLPLQSILAFGVVGWLLVPIGVIQSYLKLNPYHFFALILLWTGNCILLPLLSNYPFNYEMQSIVRTWILLAHVCCAIWIGFGLQSIVSLIVTRFPAIGLAPKNLAGLLIIIVTLGQLAANAPVNYRANEDFVDFWGRTILSRLEPNAILFVRGDYQTGPLGFLHHVEGVRPDIEIYNIDNVLFGNRLMDPKASIVAQQKALIAFIQSARRPVYSIYPLDLPSEDHGLFFKYNAARPGLQSIDLDDAFFNRLLAVHETRPFKDPSTRILVDNLVYDYARLVIGLAVTGENHSPEFVKRLTRVSQTLAGKVWTLHHMLGAVEPGQIDKARLLGLAQAGEQQITPETNVGVAAKFYMHVAELMLVEPEDQPLALAYYQQARLFQQAGVGPGLVCESASRHLSRQSLQQLDCPPAKH